jgi:pyridoxine 4-dehydrogenase
VSTLLVCYYIVLYCCIHSVTSLENPELEKLVNKACESDVAFFDTAERYGSHIKAAMGMGWGETEQMTREFLSRQVQDQDANAETGASNAIVATKFTPTPWRTSVESVVKACEDSCQRLGVSSIPLYQLHMPDIVQPAARLWGNKGRNEKDQIYWEGLAECYDRGLVQNVGVCNYGPTLLEECQEALAKRGVPLVSNQIAYSLIGRHNGSQETLDKGNSLGIQTIAYFPFAMGLLTGKYSSKDAGEHVASTRDNNRSNSLWTSEKSKLEAKDLNLYLSGDGKRIPKGGVSPLLKVMEQIALTRKKTVAQVALNYIICKGAIPIPGARTAAQLEDNMGALGWRLSSTEIQLLESEADRLGFGFEGAGFKRTSEKFVGYGVEKWTLT